MTMYGRRPRTAVAAAGLMLALVGCGGGESERSGDAVAGANSGERGGGTGDSMWAAGAVSAAADALEQKLGHPPKVLQVTVIEKQVDFQVQDEDKPKNLDNYTFKDNELRAPVPVEIIGAGNVEDAVFPLASVKLDAVPKLVQAGLHLGLEGGKIQAMVLGRQPVTGKVGWSISVDGTRQDKVLGATRDGKITGEQ